jgi:alkylation response protein AidB-like acyl-CoA dehydrogenase
MAWQHGFNETFFEDVRIPAGNVVGEVNRGWYVAVTLLDFERSNIKEAVDRRRDLDNIIEYARSEAGRPKARLTPTIRAELADRYVETEVGFNFSFRVISMQASGRIPNYEASTSRMFLVELDQRVARSGTKVFGLYSNLWDEEDGRSPARATSTRRYVTTVSRTIAGGSSEIQRNIIASRGLGLPRG